MKIIKTIRSRWRTTTLRWANTTTTHRVVFVLVGNLRHGVTITVRIVYGHLFNQWQRAKSLLNQSEYLDTARSPHGTNRTVTTSHSQENDSNKQRILTIHKVFQGMWVLNTMVTEFDDRFSIRVVRYDSKTWTHWGILKVPYHLYNEVLRHLEVRASDASRSVHYDSYIHSVTTRGVCGLLALK